MPNWEALGMMPAKPAPRLCAVNVESFDSPIQWLSKFLRAKGYDVARAELDPYLERWLFYEHSGRFVVAVLHEHVEALLTTLVYPAIVEGD